MCFACAGSNPRRFLSLSRFGLTLHFSYLTTRFSSTILFLSFVHSPQTMPRAVQFSFSITIPSCESEKHPLYSVCQFCQPPFNSFCPLSESTKRCLASMENYFLDSSQVIANDRAFTLRLRPELPWVPCGPSVMMQCSGFTKKCSK